MTALESYVERRAEKERQHKSKKSISSCVMFCDTLCVVKGTHSVFPLLFELNILP